jgi:hypothetical protein
MSRGGISYQAEERENERLAGLYSFGRRLVSLRACRQAPPQALTFMWRLSHKMYEL